MTSAADAKNSAIDLPINIPRSDCIQAPMPNKQAHLLVGF